MDSLFHPPADAWQRLAPAYTTVATVSALVANLVGWAPVLVLGFVFFDGARLWLLLAAALAWLVWRLVRARRYARSWGYAERGEDLCISHGLWFKSLTVVPYGRLQLAKVEAGPLQRAFGLATVTLVTASPQSGASIPGLAAVEAQRLRDRLIEVGEARGAGL
ncbi:MAG: PH domain-containing protein [Actinomycetia bacterium]|nr:PH domain-containing protein [Actinomycetes bacterium]